MKKSFVFLLSVIVAVAVSLAQTSLNDMSDNKALKDATVLMHTTEGDITLRLYGDTPRHLENFVKLVKDGYYDGVLFHRVIREFMVQTGDPDSKDAAPGAMLGMGDPGYTLEAEIDCPRYFHKRGALAAARQGDQTNPERRSSGSQFYIVTGRTFTPSQLDQMEHSMGMQQKQEIFNRLASENRDSIMSLRRNRDQAGLQALQDSLVQQTEAEAARNPFHFTKEQREAYTTVGGAPHLDGGYTVFGEVVSGLDVVARIENVATDRSDRPKEDVKIISMSVVE